jgi:gluconolactonase
MVRPACLLLCFACSASQDVGSGAGAAGASVSSGGSSGTGGVDQGIDAGATAGAGGADPSNDDGAAGGSGLTDASMGAHDSKAAGNACPVGQVFGDPLAGNPTPALVQNGIGFLEGPVWIAERSLLYYSNFEGTANNGRIRSFDPVTGTLSIFIEGIGTNGLAVDGDGMILAGFHEMQRVLRINPTTGQRSDVLGGDSYMNMPFNSVNDLVARADGHIYFTDPSYQRGARPGQSINGSYHLTPAGVASLIESDDAPNGIALSPDGKWLYVAGSGSPHAVVRYEVTADGSVVTPGKKINSAASDGMTVDCAGNLYLTTGGTSGGKITVLTPEGSLVGELTNGFSGGTTNVSFGGRERKTLFVTTSDALFKVELGVPGLP